LEFEAPIVKSIKLVNNDSEQAAAHNEPLSAPVSNFEPIRGKLKSACEFRLVIATQNNHIYTIFFDRCYLQRHKTIHIKKTDADFLAHLQG